MNNEFYVSGITYAIEQLHQFRDDCAIRALGSLIKDIKTVVFLQQALTE
jgi:hypothetical protein